MLWLHCVVALPLRVVDEQAAMAAVGCMATRSEIDKELSIMGPQVCTVVLANRY